VANWRGETLLLLLGVSVTILANPLPISPISFATTLLDLRAGFMYADIALPLLVVSPLVAVAIAEAIKEAATST
jgi:hypothetical protein